MAALKDSGWRRRGKLDASWKPLAFRKDASRRRGAGARQVGCILEALSGNLCRCGGYEKYVDACLAVARGEFGPVPKGGDLYV
ncbi:MAG: hypothetical protein J6N19_12545 [Clostridium sp.]|nr:hypothetical protein [Clostridium sp.]